MSRLASSGRRTGQNVRVSAVALTIGGFCVVLGTARTASAIEPRTRDEIISMSNAAMGFSYWWGHGRYSMSAAKPGGTCSGNCGNCTHSGSYGGDCSGLVAKVWQVPGPTAFDNDEHPYSTVSFRGDTTHWKPIPRGEAKRGDAFTYNVSGAGHIFVYERDDQAGKVVAFECIGCSYGCQHRTRSYSDKPYIVIRRDLVKDDVAPPPPPPPPPPPAAPKLAAKFIGQGSSLGDPSGGISVYAACAGEAFSFYFELANVGDGPWKDLGAAGNDWGQRVSLGALNDAPGPITPGVGRVSLNTTQNHAPAPSGGDCNDADGCKRVRFAVDGKAPDAAGIVRTSWRLVDEGRAWFGPLMYLDFDVKACAAPPDPEPQAGAGGSASSGKGGAPATGGASSGKAGAAGKAGTSGSSAAPLPNPDDPGFDPIEEGDGEQSPSAQGGAAGKPSVEPGPTGGGGGGGAGGKRASARRVNVNDSPSDSTSEGACSLAASPRETPGTLGLGLLAALGLVAARRKR